MKNRVAPIKRANVTENILYCSKCFGDILTDSIGSVCIRANGHDLSAELPKAPEKRSIGQGSTNVVDTARVYLKTAPLMDQVSHYIVAYIGVIKIIEWGACRIMQRFAYVVYVPENVKIRVRLAAAKSVLKVTKVCRICILSDPEILVIRIKAVNVMHRSYNKIRFKLLIKCRKLVCIPFGKTELYAALDR